MASLGERFKSAWNVFTNADEYIFNRNYAPRDYYSQVSSFRPDRVRLTRGNERSIVTSVYNRIAIDISQIAIKHVRLNEEGGFIEEINSGLNECLNLSANLDQTGKAFIQDAVLTLFDEGSVALVPTDTSLNPNNTDSYDILSIRVGKIVEWMPSHVKVKVYNEVKGIKQEVVVPKRSVAIIENPFYSIMNEPNSTLQRLIRKLNLLDVIDEQSGSGKLDLIIQLPYVIKTEARKQQAENRRKDIEMQLAGSKYGIAYTDGTEHITQLNRPVENNLLKQVEYLTDMLYSQVGVTQDILNGSADEQSLVNYEQNVLVPLITPFVDEMKRKFLTKTARTQGQSIMYFKDPFKLIPISKLADLADKFTRNEIMSPNEMRQKVGLKPSKDPQADELRNRNINSEKGANFAKSQSDKSIESKVNTDK